MVLFGVGSRYEDNTEAGIAHLLEHMIYKGSKTMPDALSVSKAIENIGGEHNAFTSKEYTGYYTKVASKYLDKSLQFLSDLVTNPIFDPQELEREKQVIYQEFDMYQDLPLEVVSERFEMALLGQNSLGRSIIGLKESIAKVDQKKLFEFKDNYYCGKNMVIVVAGNISAMSESLLKKMIEESFSLKGGQTALYPKITLPKKETFLKVEKDTEQSHLVIGFLGADSYNLDRYRLKMLTLILGGSMSSRMFTEIREKRGLAYVVRTSSSSYLDTGMIETYAGVPHQEVNNAKEAILNEYKKVKEKGITKEELDRAKKIMLGRILLSQEDINEVASRYGLLELLSDRIITTDELISLYQKMSKKEIGETAKKYLDDSRLTICQLGR